jgi:peptidoglycan/xylan/chitin deacetylase (PgdA/CDA1 family)/uncharacterized protein with GYD domain
MSALLAVLLVFPVVVMYHRVDTAAPGDPTSQHLTISPVQFASELRSIARLGLHTIGIAELARDVAVHQSPVHAVVLTFDDGYSDQFQYAFPILERFGDRATFFVNVATIGTPNHLSWQDVETMSRAGMSIECHGMSHADLAELNTTGQTYQIDRCIAALSAHVPGAVLAYAYPSGAFNAQTLALERQAGLLFGFTTDPRFQNDRLSPYEVTRIRVMSGMSDAFFSALLERTHNYVEFVPATASPVTKPRKTNGGIPMPKYLVQAHYTAEGARGILKGGASARRKAVEELLASVGGKLEEFYFAFGEDDAIIIVDLPGNEAALAVGMAVSASGAVRTRTTVLLAIDEVDRAVKRELHYRPPGT